MVFIFLFAFFPFRELRGGRKKEDAKIHTPYAASFAPIIIKHQNVDNVLHKFVLG